MRSVQVSSVSVHCRVGVALFYHLLNGIRHLCWDVGWGFELPQVYVSGYVAMVVAGLLTGVVFMFSLKNRA
ncbi:MAG: hypothetical protein CM1200mP41_17760 [Gammaproteobacteria bacterium]|nr:MAG: hypothetical protein CM1200mP41_17760 [Gammaproteobacteria bacterium]